MLKLISRVTLILVVLTSCTVTYMFRNKIGDEFFVKNFRALFNRSNINAILESLSRKEALKSLATADDPGFSILLSFTTFLSGEGLFYQDGTIAEFPMLYILSILFFHLLTVAIVFTTRSISEQMKVAIFVFFLFPVSLAVFSGFDVYLFPIYAMCFSFVIFSELRLEKTNFLKSSFLSLLIGLCEMMRSGSGLHLIFALLFYFFISRTTYKLRLKNIAILFLPYFVMKNVPYLFFHRSGHTFWHAVHAGMFEFGGCVGSKGESWPFFIFPMEDLSRDKVIHCITNWDDLTQHLVAKLNGIKGIYSPEYDKVLKTQTLELLGSHFFSFVSLIIERLIRIFSFAPYRSYGTAGNLNPEFDAFSYIWGISCLTLTGYAIYKNRQSRMFQLLGLFLLLAAAPPLLVHSGYLIYNIPVYFVITLIWALAFIPHKSPAHE